MVNNEAVFLRTLEGIERRLLHYLLLLGNNCVNHAHMNEFHCKLIIMSSRMPRITNCNN